MLQINLQDKKNQRRNGMLIKVSCAIAVVRTLWTL